MGFDILVFLWHLVPAPPRIAILFRGQIGLVDQLSIDGDVAHCVHVDHLTGQTDNSLDERFARFLRIPENNYLAAFDVPEHVLELIDEDSFVVLEPRLHGGAFNLNGLNYEDDDEDRKDRGKDQVASDRLHFRPQSGGGDGLLGIHYGDIGIIFGG